MTRFQLVFRDGDGDRSEFRYDNGDGAPHIDGKLIVDGETYLIRGVEWVIRREGCGGSLKTCRGSYARSLSSRCPPRSGDGPGRRGRSRGRPTSRKGNGKTLTRGLRSG